MKKIFILFFICTILLIIPIPGCVSVDTNDTAIASEETGEDLQEESVVSTEKSEDNVTVDKSQDEVTVDEQVLLDEEGIIITLKSLSMDSFWGPSLKVLIENNRNEGITVQTRNGAINGVMIDTMFSCDVAPDKKANDEITFASSDLKIAQIETIKDIEFMFHIFNTETWDTIFDSDTINITTSADKSFTQTYDDSGFIVLDQNDFKIVLKKLDSEDSFWGADIYLYVENNSDKDATIQIRDTSVNGFMIDPIFSCDVLAGKKAFDSITFLESDLKENNIESIDELEFYFHIFESDGWDTIFDSELIKVSFEG